LEDVGGVDRAAREIRIKSRAGSSKGTNLWTVRIVVQIAIQIIGSHGSGITAGVFELYLTGEDTDAHVIVAGIGIEGDKTVVGIHVSDTGDCHGLTREEDLIVGIEEITVGGERVADGASTRGLTKEIIKEKGGIIGEHDIDGSRGRRRSLPGGDGSRSVNSTRQERELGADGPGYRGRGKCIDNIDTQKEFGGRIIRRGHFQNEDFFSKRIGDVIGSVERLSPILECSSKRATKLDKQMGRSRNSVEIMNNRIGLTRNRA